MKEKEKAEKELQQAKRLRKEMREAGFPHFPWLPSDDGTNWFNTETDETRPYPPSSSSGARRKRKKRRRKRTSRSSYVPRRRARHVRDAPGRIVSGFFGNYDPGSHFFGVWSCLWNTYSMLCLVRQWIPSFVSLRWFFVPVYRAATCSVLVLPEVFRIIGFYWDDFTFVFVFYSELGSTADTCTTSVYGACEACVSVFSAQLGSTTDTCGASVYEAFLENSRSSTSLSFCRGRSPWSCFLADHRDFPLAVRYQVVDALVVHVEQVHFFSWRSGSSHGPDCSSDLLLQTL